MDEKKKKKIREVFFMIMVSSVLTFGLLIIIPAIAPMEMLSDNVQYLRKIVLIIELVSCSVLWGMEIENESVSERIDAALAISIISMSLSLY